MTKSLETGFVPADRIISAIDAAMETRWPWEFPGGPHDDPTPLAPLTRYWDPTDLRSIVDPKGRNGGWIEFDMADLMICALGLVELWRGELEDLYLAVNLGPVEPGSLDFTKAIDQRKCARGECDNLIPLTTGRGRPRKYCSNRCKQMDRVRKAPVGMARCAMPGCSNEMPRPTGRRSHQKYCSKSCQQKAYNLRSGRTKKVLLRPGSELSRFESYCKNGHERTEENTKVTASGTRTCRVCLREWERERTRRRRQERKAA